jgi:integrase
MLKRAGLPKIRLHDSRHTTLSLMEKAGVPISIISKWAGHYDSSFTMKTYVHASDEEPEAGPSGARQDSPHRLDPVRDCERHGLKQA